MHRLDRLFKNSITDYIIIALGASVYGASVAVFTSKNNIAPGGLTGVATMLDYLFSLPIGAMIFVMNIPLFLWAFFESGKRFVLKTMIGTALVSVFIDIFQAVLPFYSGSPHNFKVAVRKTYFSAAIASRIIFATLSQASDIA